MTDDNEYVRRLQQRVQQWSDKYPAKRAELECYAWLAFCPPIGALTKPIPSWVQWRLDRDVAEQIRVLKGWPDEQTFLLTDACK